MLKKPVALAAAACTSRQIPDHGTHAASSVNLVQIPCASWQPSATGNVRAQKLPPIPQSHARSNSLTEMQHSKCKGEHFHCTESGTEIHTGL